MWPLNNFIEIMLNDWNVNIKISGGNSSKYFHQMNLVDKKFGNLYSNHKVYMYEHIFKAKSNQAIFYLPVKMKKMSTMIKV